MGVESLLGMLPPMRPVSVALRRSWRHVTHTSGEHGRIVDGGHSRMVDIGAFEAQIFQPDVCKIRKRKVPVNENRYR